MSDARSAVRLVLSLGFCMLIAACSRLQTNDRDVAFQENVRGYGAALRWGHMNTAKSYLRGRDGRVLATGAALRDNLRVTGYRTLNTQFRADGNEAWVEASLTYFLVDRGVVRQARDRQLWWYDPENRRWFLEGELPAVLLEGAAEDPR